jgi:hypothetical protein
MDKGVNLETIFFVYLMFGFAITLIIVWGVFWFVVLRSKADPLAIINSSKFLHILTVGFTLFALIILSLARVLSGEIVGTLIGGLIGYVLGSNRGINEKKVDKVERDAQKALPDHSPEPPPTE